MSFWTQAYWTPYRGIDTTLREWAISNEKVGIKCSFAFLRKGSGGGVVYGFGVWRVKSWVKNVPDTNKYIAVFFNRMGMITLDISTACGYNFQKEHYLVLLNPLVGGLIHIIPTSSWSRYARASKWVDAEWRYALKQKGADYIEPVPIDPPGSCPPPDELSRKHFNDKLLYIINSSETAQ